MKWEGSVGDNWELVRRVKAGNSWHPATDQLRGTDVYGTFVNDSSVDSTFSIAYDLDQVQDFLFITGDKEKWLIASKFSVMNDGSWYQNEARDIKKSSISTTPYQAKWYRRSGHKEDPWISLTDHGGAIGAGDILYGENRFGGGHARNILPLHNGANVYIRKTGLCISSRFLFERWLKQ